jgi:predicted AAA+ superfamily ATPase
MINRYCRKLIESRLGLSPAVGLVGPRQCGKTTLAKSLGDRYFDLEQESDRLRLDVAWDETVAADGVTVFDEVQAWPAVFPRLRGAIDAARDRRGRFLLLGSVSPVLMREVGESLAGRLALVELTPFLLGELPEAGLDGHWLHGGFPDGGVREAARFPAWQRDYLALMAARDLPNWGLTAKPQVTDRLMAMLAAIHGQMWNASQIGQGLGLSYHTVDAHVDLLEGAFLVRRLRPLAANLGKRLVRRPKLYWRDSGLLHALLRVPDQETLLRQPWVGASWEGFVIGQVLDTCMARGLDAAPSFFRSSAGEEADLILDLPGERWAVEVKLTSQPGADDLTRLKRVAELVGAKRAILVSRQDEVVESGGILCCPLQHLLGQIV